MKHILMNTYANSVKNMTHSTQNFCNNEYYKSFTPDRILKSLDLLVIFITSAQAIIFKNGTIMSLSIFNIIAWWKFLKLSYKFINNIIEIWK